MSFGVRASVAGRTASRLAPAHPPPAQGRKSPSCATCPPTTSPRARQRTATVGADGGSDRPRTAPHLGRARPPLPAVRAPPHAGSWGCEHVNPGLMRMLDRLRTHRRRSWALSARRCLQTAPAVLWRSSDGRPTTAEEPAAPPTAGSPTRPPGSATFLTTTSTTAA